MSNTDVSPGEDYQSLIHNSEPIDPDDSRYEKIFKDVQGSIIKSYGRHYNLYIFISFNQAKIEEAKQWIRDEIASNVTSAWKQFQDTKFYKDKIQELENQELDHSTEREELCQNFFLSYQGYQTLGIKMDQSDPMFKWGMKNWWEESYKSENSSASPDYWDVGGKDNIHALIMVAHNNLETLKNETAHIIEKFEGRGVGNIITCEAGYVLRNEQDQFVGPFGFVDNISQPLFLKKHYDEYRSQQSIEKWDPKASLSLVFVKDPFGEPYSFGSYCVWQKLETNYECFQEKVKELANILECDQERASALVVGRFKDGTPLALYPEQKNNNIIENSFNYSDDLKGARCPFQSHIRKVNPRGDRDDIPLDPETRKQNRIFRAGVIYCEDPQAQTTSESKILLGLNKLEYLNKVKERSLTDKIESISGLLFLSFQSDIVNQFSKILQDWADDRKFPRRGEPKYLDPVIGHPNTKLQIQPPQPQQWPQKWNGEENLRQEDFRPSPFYGCVKDKGGEFFFAPSISFLKKLL